MASAHREDRIIHAVPCPDCGAKVGQLCHVLEKSWNPAGLAGPSVPHRPILHTARRKAWHAKRGPVAPMKPKEIPNA